MPSAAAFLVTDTNGVRRLEDRYPPAELWAHRVVDGRWLDDEGRVLTVATLSLAPRLHDEEKPLTRREYDAETSFLSRKDEKLRLRAIRLLAPIGLAEEGEKPRQLPRGLKECRYWEGTNTSAVVCAFLPEDADFWTLAAWTLAEGDDHEEARKLFEERFFDEYFKRFPPASRPRRARRTKERPSERQLLKEDVRHSVAACPDWRFTDSDSFALVDALGNDRTLATAVTNVIPALRGRFAAVMPTPLDGSNVLAVARVFANREDYLAVVGEELAWSAAYWSPVRRELVAYLPATGRAELMKTFRHESFHQYLSYAASMIAVSPWLNEGYAQYFEEDEAVPVPPELDLELLSAMLPVLMQMDYEEFYAGSEEARRLKYRLAWMLAYFIEHGAPEVRFQPFKNLKRDYLAALLDTKDMHLATERAFENADRFKEFVEEWAKFWGNM